MAISTAPGGSTRTARLMARSVAQRDLPGTAVRNLENWGLANLLFLMSTMFASKFYIDTDLHFVGYLSCLTWVLVALIKGYAPIRIPLFMGVVVAFQIWLAFTTLYAEVTIARRTVFNPTNYAIFLYFLAFVQGSMLAYRSHRIRTTFCRIMLGIFAVSAVTAYLQVLGWGPAKSLLVLSAEFTMEGSEGTVVRASGLMQDIGWTVLFHTIGALLIGSQLHYRALKWYEWAAIVGFLLAGILPQTRNQVPGLILTAVWIAVLAIRRHGVPAVIGSALAATSIATFVTLSSDRFSYLLGGGTGSLTFRQEKLWSQAWNAYREMPWTGIGQEAAFVSYQSQVFPNKWVSLNFMDGGYMLALAWGGLVGLALLIAATAIGFAQAVMLAKTPTPDPWAKALRNCLVLVAFYFAFGMFFGNVWGTPYRAFPFMLMGLALATYRPATRSEERAPEPLPTVGAATP